MKLYFAGLDNNTYWKKLKELDLEVNRVLISYWHNRKKTLEERKNLDLFVDSGGFTARQGGITISIKDYGEFLLKNKGNYTVCANLDTLDFDESQEHQSYLEGLGITPLPVYHCNDYLDGRLDIFKEWCKKYDYIALGGVAGVTTSIKQLEGFLNFCFKYTSANNVKVHGFGMTSVGLLLKYPYYSVDSTSWMAAMRYGQIQQWDRKNFKFTGGSYKDKNRAFRMDYDSKVLDGYLHRIEQMVKAYLQMEEDITNLWAKRGVIWKD